MAEIRTVVEVIERLTEGLRGPRHSAEFEVEENDISGLAEGAMKVTRLLANNPRIMTLEDAIDEPSERLAQLIVAALAKAIREIRYAGVTVFLADQNVHFCRKTANRDYIIHKGNIRYQDEMKNILENEEIVKKYLAV